MVIASLRDEVEGAIAGTAPARVPPAHPMPPTATPGHHRPLQSCSRPVSDRGGIGVRSWLFSTAFALFFAAVVTATPAKEGQALYEEYCAACHGLALEGQPNWMIRNEDGRLPAPPHDETGHAWHHSDRQLFEIVRDRLAVIAPGYETDMPAFGRELSDAQILSILDYLKSHWPPRERNFQEERSRNDPIN